MLNYSVLIFENRNSPEDAIKLAESALADASQVINTTSEDITDEADQIMLLLWDNIEIWTAAIYDEKSNQIIYT